MKKLPCAKTALQSMLLFILLLVGCNGKKEEQKNVPKEGDWYERVIDRKRLNVLKAGTGEELNNFANANYMGSDTSYWVRRTFYARDYRVQYDDKFKNSPCVIFREDTSFESESKDFPSLGIQAATFKGISIRYKIVPKELLKKDYIRIKTDDD